MILSNVGLHSALDRGRLVIRPEPSPRAPEPTDPARYCPYDTHSVDLTLGNEIVIPLPGTEIVPIVVENRRGSSRTLSHYSVLASNPLLPDEGF
jgi:hypothetical protein